MPGGSITRQPLNLIIDNLASRVAGVNQVGGYQIINQSLTATIWVAANPSVGDGNGTSIPPGTSLRWTVPDDVYIILGADTDSVTAGQAAVIVSYDTYDWAPSPAAIAAAVLNAGVIIFDKEQTLVPDGIYDITGGAIYFPSPVTSYDVSTYATLRINFRATATVTGYCMLQVTWTDATFTNTITESIIIRTTVNRWVGSLPIKGTRVRFQITGPAGNDVGFSATVTTRQTEDIQQALASAPPTYYLGNYSAAVGPGLLSVQYSEPWFGMVQVQTRAELLGLNPLRLGYVMFSNEPLGGGSTNDVLVPMMMDNGVAANPFDVQGPCMYVHVFGNTYCTVTYEIALYGAPLRIEWYNESAGVLNLRTRVMPVRYA